MNKKKNDFVIWVAMGFNALILLSLVLLAIFAPLAEESVWRTFSMFWYLSFGWIAGRLSND